MVLLVHIELLLPSGVATVWQMPLNPNTPLSTSELNSLRRIDGIPPPRAALFAGWFGYAT